VVSTSASPNVRSQVTQFTDQDPGWGTAVPSIMDGTRSVAYSENTELGEFLKRPINIWNQTWLSTDTANKVWVFDPWYLYLSNPQITKKFETYRLMQGSLNVKFLINANGFSYGCMMAYYHPLQYQDTTAGYPEPTSVTDVPASGIRPAHAFFTMDKEHLVRHSQKPRVFLMPQTSTGGTLKLPFLWQENWLDLTGGDVDKLGKIFLCQLNSLNSLTLTDTARVSITAYAWMEDCKVSLATTMGLSLFHKPTGVSTYKITNTWPEGLPLGNSVTPAVSTSKVAESHSGNDEYGTGPVSKVANSVALAADSLSDAPVIGPYARASSLIANGIGRLASLFGYSRPTVVADIVPYKPIYLGNLANTDAGDTSQKLTLDSKQEVSIDPRVVGLPPNDEMTIRSIAGRESYFQTITWGGDTGTAGNQYGAGKRLMNCLVTPFLQRTKATTGRSDKNSIQHNMTGCCYAALPFAAWRGTMRYRFQIIASQFHRGRIRIVWDPRKIVEEGGSSYQLWETANVMSCIVDLAEHRDFTVDIGWGQPNTYCITGIDPGNHSIVDSSLYIAGATGANTNLKDEWSNGVIGIYIVNALVSTATGSAGSTTMPSAYINMFVSCPDLDVANPEEAALQNWTTSLPEGIPSSATLKVAESHGGFDEVEPVHAPVASGAADFCLGPPVPPLDSKTSSVFYGDPIVSLRTLMKRYCFHMALACYHNKTGIIDNQASVVIYTFPDYPQPYGNALKLWAPNYVSLTPSSATRTEYGWCPAKQSYLSFYSPAYACRRGGIRWKYMYKAKDVDNVVNDKYKMTPPTFLVARGTWPRPTFETRQVTAKSNRYENLSTDYKKNFPSGEGGLFVTNTDGNPIIEVELPFYCMYRFLTTKQPAYPTSPGGQYTRESIARNILPTHSVTCPLPGNKNRTVPLLSYVAAADDYSLHMYLGPPLMYHINGATDVASKLMKIDPYSVHG